MVEKMIYVAFDGTEFRDEEECDKYENNFLKNSTIECWDYHGLKIYNLSKDCISSKPHNTYRCILYKQFYLIRKNGNQLSYHTKR